MKPWARLEIGYLNHPKFLSLNANAICLWHEGKNYCDAHHTDGVIPRDALKTFRFRGARAVQQLLTSCGEKTDGTPYAALWEPIGVGYRMHDYLDHNDARDEILARLEKADERREQERQRKAVWRDQKKQKRDMSRGTNNGTATGLSRSTTETQTESETSTDPIGSVARETIDAEFSEFRDAYPRERRKGGERAYAAYVAARQVGASHVHLMAALSNHKQSEQWSERHVIPAMDKWLEEERWRQELEPARVHRPGPVEYFGRNECPHDSPKCTSRVQCITRDEAAS